jgi:hypothetical protein
VNQGRKQSQKWLCSSPTIFWNHLIKLWTFLDNLLKSIFPSRNVNHKIEVVFGSALLSKALYRLNQKELKELKTQINNPFNWRYIRQNKLPYGAPILFLDKKDRKLRMCIDCHALNNISMKKNYSSLPLKYATWTSTVCAYLVGRCVL